MATHRPFVQGRHVVRALGVDGVHRALLKLPQCCQLLLGQKLVSVLLLPSRMQTAIGRRICLQVLSMLLEVVHVVFVPFGDSRAAGTAAHQFVALCTQGERGCLMVLSLTLSTALSLALCLCGKACAQQQAPEHA